MCARYTLTDPGALEELYGMPIPLSLPPRFNIAPSQTLPVARESHGRRDFALLRWGLVPSWAKDPKAGYRMINARAETVGERPAFRAAFRRRRCLVPADGFYEWQEGERKKQPWYIRLRRGGPFSFAGLWEHWEGDAELIESFTILTTKANELVRPLHHRMPVILPVEHYPLWLDADTRDAGALQALLAPCPAEALTAFPVGTEVNNPRNDLPLCIEPAAAATDP
jgi:putative SOS response-associated peptidase YedK